MEFSHEGRSFVRLRRKLQLLRSNTSTRNAPRRCNPLRFQIYFFRFLLLISFHCWCYHFKNWNIPSLVFVLFLILVLVPWSLSLSFCYHRHCHRPPTCHCPHQQHLGIKCNSHKRIWSTLLLCKSVFTKVLMGDFDYKCILQNLHKCTFQCHSCPSLLSSSQHSLLWKYTYHVAFTISIQASQSQQWCGTTGQWSWFQRTTLWPSPLDAGTSSHS